MKIKNVLSLLCTIIVVSLCISCSFSSKNSIEYLPFQEAEDGQWGLISMDGKVLFKEEFKEQITAVRDNRFFAKTKSGFWDLYEASEKPQKLGEEYKSVSGFFDGHAIVAKKNEPVSIIDINGKVIKVLDNIEGKEVHGVRTFSEGYAVFMTTDSLFGAVDDNGKCVIKPEYCELNNCSDGKFIGIHGKYKKFVEKNQEAKYNYSVITTSEKVLFEFAGNKYENMYLGFTDGKLPVSVKRDGKEFWGIIDDNGQYIVNPSSKLKRIGTIKGDEFTYSNGEAWGLMNIKGETIIRAKYDYLYQDGEDILIALTNKKDQSEYKFINKKDEQIGKETYVNVYPYSIFDNRNTVVKQNDKIYTIIDKKGEPLKELPDMVNINLSVGDSYIESDYVDFKKLVDAFQITEEGILGYTSKTSAKELVKQSAKLGLLYGTKEHPAADPYWFDTRTSVDLYKNVSGIRGFILISFTGNLSRETYRTQRVIDYEYDDYYWYHDNKISTGYVWNKVNPNIFSLTISNSGRMQGKLSSLFKVLKSKFNAMGKVAKQNDGAIVFNLKNGKRALLYMKGNEVVVIWGELRPANQIDISSYADISEVDMPEQTSQVGDEENTDYDTAVADTAAVVDDINY